MLSITFSICIALSLDKLLGEADRFHPLVGFGLLAKNVETRLNSGLHRKLKGFIGLMLCIFPLSLAAYFLSEWVKDDALAEIILSGFILYIAIGWRSLQEHAHAVYEPLFKHDLNVAREAVSRIVSRDCEQLNETDIAVAATESVLENGADAIFAAIFWFALAGLPGVVCYRLTNTLDAMWGYKNSRFIAFGWAAARFDDVMNYVPARLTAFSYALVGHTKSGLNCWFNQAKFWKSPNAGPVMAAGAGAIQASLGGRAVYHGTTHLRPLLGLKLSNNTRASAQSIKDACNLINKTVRLWVSVFICACIITQGETILLYVKHILINAQSGLL